MTTPVSRFRRSSRGVSLIESLIALVVLGFGLATLFGMQLGMARHADLARQRSEATRLAQEKIEAWRSYAQLAPGAGAPAYEDIVDASDTPAIASNTTYVRSAIVRRHDRDLHRLMTVDVSWSDRAGEIAHVVLQSIVARSDPLDAASAVLPPQDAWRRTRDRSQHVPYTARQLGAANHGRSTLAWSGPSGGHLIFDDVTGAIVARCATQPGDATSIATDCARLDGYLLQGYIAGDLPASSPALVLDQLQYLAPSSVPECSLQAAIDQNSGAALGGLLQYRCLIQPGDDDANAATPLVWSGRLRLSGLPSGSVACRYAGTPETYTRVASPLEQQNFTISASGTCPAGTTLQPSA